MAVVDSSRTAPASRPGRAELAAALRDATYEVLPFTTAEEKVLADVPTDVALTVTTTEAKGLGPTVDLAVRLTAAGYRAAPHLAARLVRDRAHLEDLVAELTGAGVDRVFVIGGDAAEPAGDFVDALGLLEALDDMGRPFSTVGIGGYPEGHGSIAAELIERALEAKAEHATQVITQLCFDAGTTVDWARTVQARGVTCPSGSASRRDQPAEADPVSAGLGLGQSARFLKKQQNMFWRFFLPGGYSPDKLIQRLTPAFGRADNGLHGLHVFTFNELDTTEAWRQRWLARLT